MPSSSVLVIHCSPVGRTAACIPERFTSKPTNAPPVMRPLPFGSLFGKFTANTESGSFIALCFSPRPKSAENCRRGSLNPWKFFLKLFFKDLATSDYTDPEERLLRLVRTGNFRWFVGMAPISSIAGPGYKNSDTSGNKKLSPPRWRKPA
jgi:hypothetical protein